MPRPHAKRIWEENCRFETAAQRFRNRQDRILRSKRENLIDLGHRSPECFKFCRSEDSEPGVRTAVLEGERGAPAHDSVAEPVRRANDEAKGIQLRRIGTWRQVDPALLSRDEKVRPWRLPAIVYPEPICRRPADLLLKCGIDIRRKLLGIARVIGNFLFENDAPFRKAGSIDGRGYDRSVGADCQPGCQRRGRTQTVEKRHPNSSVSGTLIHEHSDGSGFSQ